MTITRDGDYIWDTTTIDWELGNEMKPVWKSKTMWFNGIAIVLTYILNHTSVFPSLGIGMQTQITIIAIANLVLRLVTNTGVSLK